MSENSNSTSILIVGAGAVGLVYAYHVSQLDNVRVALIARSNYEQIKEKGIEIQIKHPEVKDEPSKSFHPNLLIQNSKREDPQFAYHYDYIIIAAKSQGTDAISGLQNYIGPSSLMVLAQNGIDIEQPYLDMYPGIKLASSIVRVATAIENNSQGNVVSYYSNRMMIQLGLIQDDGSSSSSQPATVSLRKLSEIQTKAGIHSEIIENVKQQRWEKLLWNGTFNTLCAITDVTPKELMNNGLDTVARQVMTEIWTIAERDLRGGEGKKEREAKDYWVPMSKVDEIIETTMTSSFSGTTGFVPSTLQDVRKGKPLEFEALTGNAVRLAHKLGIAVPTLDVVYGLIKVLNYKLQNQSENKNKKK